MRFFHFVPFLAALALLSACGDREPVLTGERLTVRAALDPEATSADAQAARAADAARAVPVSLPAASANAEWTHRNGNAQHRLAHPALAPVQGRVFTANIGQGNDRKHRITADPVVAGERIYTMDSRAQVSAISTGGATVWQADLTPGTDRADDASGGGISIEGGRVFAATGFGELVALDAGTGAVIWRQDFDAGVGGAPTVADGVVYVAGRDSTAWSVRASDGRVNWRLAGTPAAAGVGGVSAPAVSGDQVLFPFASGEVLAVNRADGTRLWLGQVGGARSGRAFGSVADLTGDPVVAGDTVYAGSAAGRLVALDAVTGTARWKAAEGAVSPVWPAGEAIYLVSDEGRLLRLDAGTGETVWAVDLPYFQKEKLKRQQAIFAHFGPVLAGGRLYVASSDGFLRSFDPASGALLAELELPGGAASAPVVAGGTLYVVSAKGQIHAFR